jgi:hypothetical protein
MKADLTQTELSLPNEFLENITVKEGDFFNTLDGVASSNSAPQFKENTDFQPLQPGDLPPATGQGPQNPNTDLNIQSIVSGELAVNLMNSFIPVIAVYGAREFMQLDVNKKAFQLTAAEKNTLAPILDKCLAQLNVSFENPWNALIISMATIYGAKFFEVVNDPDMAQPIKKAAAKVASKTAAAVSQNNGPVTFATPGYVGQRKPGETRGRRPKGL